MIKGAVYCDNKKCNKMIMDITGLQLAMELISSINLNQIWHVFPPKTGEVQGYIICPACRARYEEILEDVNSMAIEATEDFFKDFKG